MQVKVDDGSHVEIADALLTQDFNTSLVHQSLNAYLANQRQSKSLLKNRGAVTATSKKPWRQKGTGRARVGTSSNPLWRSGGATFGNQLRVYTQKLNRKMYRKSLAIILSKLFAEDRLGVVDKLTIDEPRTKLFSKEFSRFIEPKKLTLFLVDTDDRNLELASRNLVGVAVVPVSSVNIHMLMKCHRVVMTTASLKLLEGRLL